MWITYKYGLSSGYCTVLSDYKDDVLDTDDHDSVFIKIKRMSHLDKEMNVRFAKYGWHADTVVDEHIPLFATIIFAIVNGTVNYTYQAAIDKFMIYII